MSKEIVLRTSEIAQYSNIHTWLKEKLELPEHYGENLDALWDCINGHMSLPLTVLWEDDAQIGSTYKDITDLFEEAYGEIDDFEFGYLIEEE